MAARTVSGPRGSRLRAVLCLGLLAVLLGGWPVPAATAGCAGPQLAVGQRVEPEPAPTAVTIGQVVTVTGEWFHTGCDDTGQGAGCGAPPSEQEPMRGVSLVLEQGGTTVPLGTADAGDRSDRYRVDWQAQVPSDLQPGPATLQAGGASLAVELRAG